MKNNVSSLDRQAQTALWNKYNTGFSVKPTSIIEVNTLKAVNTSSNSITTNVRTSAKYKQAAMDAKEKLENSYEYSKKLDPKQGLSFIEKKKLAKKG